MPRLTTVLMTDHLAPRLTYVHTFALLIGQDVQSERPIKPVTKLSLADTLLCVLRADTLYVTTTTEGL